MENLKNGIKRIAPNFILNLFRDYKAKNQLKRWKREGKPLPPPHIIKQLVISEYQRREKIDCLVETGTYLGDMVYAQRKRFSKIHSIELSNDLYKNAMKRFNAFPHIKIHYGDSGKILNEIVPCLNEKAIFWLDGHYSGGITAKGESECPVFEELEAIFKKDLGHIILIDDARLFNGTGDYPTIDHVQSFFQRKNKNYQISIKDDIIRAVLK